MLTPAAVVAVKTLEALGVVTREQARDILALWVRPSPRLAPADIRAILATFDRNDGEVYDRDDEPAGGEPPPHVGGYPLGGRNRNESSEQ